MEEKILIKGEKGNYKIFTTTMFILGCLSAIIIGGMLGAPDTFAEFLSYFFRYLFDWVYWACFAVLALPFFLVGIIVSWWLYKMELVVTNKRVYGKIAFGKRVDLPLDLVSSVGTSAIGGIDVGTSSGRIKFKLVKNKDEVHEVISRLIMQRQEENKTANSSGSSDVNELKKYKELLDSGLITQEEFDAKKKQLLGL